jgi:hypothetical protein
VFFDKVLTKIFGTANERLIKRVMPMVALISALEADTKRLTDDELRTRTAGVPRRAGLPFLPGLSLQPAPAVEKFERLLVRTVQHAAA